MVGRQIGALSPATKPAKREKQSGVLGDLDSRPSNMKMQGTDEMKSEQSRVSIGIYMNS